MREEVRSSGTAEPFALARSSSPPPTPVASSAGASSPAAMTNVASIDWLGSAQTSKVGTQNSRPSVSTNAGGPALGSSQPSCRPWERGDLLRRLASFKSSSWFAKPKAVNSLACARRGWVNVDSDKIACESCGAQLVFTVSASWSPAEVNNAGEAFGQQLDSGHLADCPWSGNSCPDSLVQFQLTSSALIGGYKDRCDGLLQFNSLPVIATSATETMRLTRSSQLDRLLSQAPNFLSGELGPQGAEFGLQDSSSGYAHSQKLISLCGWEPRWLPNVQDYEENSIQSARNVCSADPSGDHFNSQSVHRRDALASASVKRDKGKGKMPVQESSRSSLRSPLLDCSLCSATVRIWDFRTVPRPSRFGPSNIENADPGKKMPLTRGASAASAINGWIERDQAEGRDEAATTGEGKSQSNADVDLNLTMAGGLPSTQSAMPATSEQFDRGGMGRDLMIGQPTGSEVGDRAASYESRGPISRKRNREEGGSTADKPPQHSRLQQADSIEGTVIDRDAGDEVDDGTQDSMKRARGFDLFNPYRPPLRVDSSGAGPSRNFSFEMDINANRDTAGAGQTPARESARASSVIAMDTVCHSPEDDSMESVENYPGGDIDDDVHLPSPNIHRNIEMDINTNMNGGGLDLNYSNQAQQSTCVQPAAAGSVAREVGGSSTNEGEEILNAETVTAYGGGGGGGRDQVSLGVSAGSVGMGASHEAEIHGADVSIHRTESIVGDAEPVTEVTENLGGHTGESAPGPGVMGEFVPEMMAGREDPQGDSQDMVSRSLGRADSGSKIYGSTKADSVESGEKFSHRATGRDSSNHPSLSCNAGIYSCFEASKEEVTQTGTNYDPENGIVGAMNGENDYEPGMGEFDPIKHHKMYCPWVNGNVAAASCEGENNLSSNGSSSNGNLLLCGWQLILDALDNFQSLGNAQNQTMQSESAASLYKDDHVNPNHKLVTRRSVSRSHGKH